MAELPRQSRYAHHATSRRDGELTFDEICAKIAQLSNAAASPTAIDTYSSEKLATIEELAGIARELASRRRRDA